MFTLEELRRRVDDLSDLASRSEFYNWFEENSYDAYEDAGLREVCVAIDTAFSEYYFDHIDEGSLREELAAAVRPFAQSDNAIEIVYVHVVENPARKDIARAPLLATAATVLILVTAPGFLTSSAGESIRGIVAENPSVESAQSNLAVPAVLEVSVS